MAHALQLHNMQALATLLGNLAAVMLHVRSLWVFTVCFHHRFSLCVLTTVVKVFAVCIDIDSAYLCSNAVCGIFCSA